MENPIQVKSVDHLKEIIKEYPGQFALRLNAGIRSSKIISYDKGTFYVTNEIDDSEQELTESQIMNNKFTNIGRGIRCGALYFEYYN